MRATVALLIVLPGTSLLSLIMSASSEVRDWNQVDAALDEGECSDGGSIMSFEIVEVAPAISQEKANQSNTQQNGGKEHKAEVLKHTNDGLDKYKCPICLDNPELLAVVSCGHAYCRDCVYTALSSARTADRRNGECSLCRKRVKYADTWYLEVRKA